MKDQFSIHLKDKLGNSNLPTGFDQRFLNKLDQEKREMRPKPNSTKEKISFNFWNEYLSLFAPLGLVTVLGTLIILSITIGPSPEDWQEQAEVLTNIQMQEVNALSTLPDDQWNDLISSAD